jgi:4-aminobutyrate aminotransferase-like enzyme
MKEKYELTKSQRKEYQKNLMPFWSNGFGIHLKGGKGVYFEDIHGKKYLDLTTLMFTNYLGFGNEEIAEAIFEQAKILTTVHPLFETDLRLTLVHKLASIAPKNLNRISFSIGGGPAIESGMKIALKNVAGSKNFITMWGAYHGDTFTTAAATFESTLTQAPYGNTTVLFNYISDLNNVFVRVPHPYCYRCPLNLQKETCGIACAELLRSFIKNGVVGRVAGIILEPIQSAGGQFPFPKDYLVMARKICNEFGSVLIFDEIQTFCRTGEWFAAEYFDVEPDVITFGKGLGAGVPIAGIIIHDRLKPFEDLMEDLHTFQNNHIGYAAAMKTIEIIERDDLLENTKKMGRYFTQKLFDLQKEFPEIGDIRGPGLKIGVELVKDPLTKIPIPRPITDKILAKAIKKGLFFQITGENIIKIKPALIIKEAQIDEAISILSESMREVFRN